VGLSLGFGDHVGGVAGGVRRGWLGRVGLRDVGGEPEVGEDGADDVWVLDRRDETEATATDLVTANGFSDDVSVLLRKGDGTFQAQQNLVVGDGPRSVAVGDPNGDGRPDLVTANSISNDLSVLLGTGDGTFQGERRFGAGDGPVSVAVGDLNGDGRPDLVTANEGPPFDPCGQGFEFTCEGGRKFEDRRFLRVLNKPQVAADLGESAA
jgi:hypothetical protein